MGKERGHIGTYGSFHYYHLISRRDAETENDLNNNFYNLEDYVEHLSYTGNVFADPLMDSNNLPTWYTYQTAVWSEGKRTLYTFNNKHLPISTITEGYGPHIGILGSEAFDYDENKHLLMRSQTFYSGRPTRTAIEMFKYDAFNNLIEYWDTQANGDRLNNQNKTTMTYGAFGIP